MVQRNKNLSNIAVTSIYEGETARQITAGIFYACTRTICGVAPVWRLNGPTALVVEVNGSAAPSFFAANQTNYSVMTSTGKNCLAGNNSTQQATDCPRQGLPELTEILSDFLLYMPDIDETREVLSDMFYEALMSGDEDEHPSQKHINDLVWCQRDLNTLLDYAQQIEGMRKYIHSMRDFLRKEKAGKTVVFPAQLTTNI